VDGVTAATEPCRRVLDRQPGEQAGCEEELLGVFIQHPAALGRTVWMKS